MNHRGVIDISLAELADRAIRFYMHLDAIEREFFLHSPGLAGDATPRDKPEFLDNFRSCMQLTINAVARLYRKAKTMSSIEDFEIVLGVIQQAFKSIDTLHESGLIHLPRPSEPIELRRFCRLISKHVLKPHQSNLAVYVTESTSDGAFAAGPIAAVKENNFKKMADMTDSVCQDEIRHVAHYANTPSSTIHVSIPRVDANNPLHWPTIMHEVAHRLLPENDILERFLAWCPTSTIAAFKINEINIKSWLTEVWCDLFAALLMGPAFLLSQFAAFISETPVGGSINREHPPSGIRLRLINYILVHRYPIVKYGRLQVLIAQAIESIEYWDGKYQISIETNDSLRSIYTAMRTYFQEHFFSGSGSESENFQQRYAKIVSTIHSIEQSTLQHMVKELQAGLPISSKPIRKQLLASDEPSSMQEILLAAWLHRLDDRNSDVLKTLDASLSNDVDWTKVTKSLLIKAERFTESYLRSLQISEWLHLLKPAKTSVLQVKGTPLQKLRRLKPSILNDNEIVTLLNSKLLRIIPMVDLDQQLGSTSLDIRLGTSFQVYMPACRRVPDRNVSLLDSHDSRRIDLDYLEHVMLLPGQSMLAHSFEYIKLPDWIAADLDGRSSYARLGLEVHMTAGMIDPGFEGVVTFELLNSGPNPIRLFPGLRIAQLRFMSIQTPSRPYSKRHSAKYRGLLQHNTSLYMSDPDFKRIQEEIETFNS